jgi:osmoprotectant transport system permease protein
MTLADAGNGLPGLNRVPIWFNDPGNWSGPTGLLALLHEHVVYTLIILTLALLLAIPVGLVIGHTGRGAVLVAGLANGLRAAPSLGLLIFLVVVVSPRIHFAGSLGGVVAHGSLPYVIPALVVLLILAVPPILTNTYAGVQSVDPATRDAARGTGMTPLQVVLKVELPCALPLILSGIRSATLQVIASLSVAAYAPLVGGLGRLIVDSDQNLTDPRYGYPAMVAAGITIAVLAVVADVALNLLQRSVVSPGISGHPSRRTLLSRAAAFRPPTRVRLGTATTDTAHSTPLSRPEQS